MPDFYQRRPKFYSAAKALPRRAISRGNHSISPFLSRAALLSLIAGVGFAVSAQAASTVGGDPGQVIADGVSADLGDQSENPWNIGSLLVGDTGHGTLDITTLSVVSADSVTIGKGATGSGTLNLGRGGVLATGGVAKGDGSASLNFDGGTLRATRANTNFLSGFTGADITLGASGATIDSNSYNIGVSSPFSGAGGLTKTGTGTLTLSGTNTYTGNTAVNNGTLSVTGTLGEGNYGGGISIAKGATFSFGNTTATTTQNLNGVISGEGALTKSGASTLTLLGINNYTGATTINAGTLALFGSGSIEKSSGVWLATAGTFDISGTKAGAAIKTLNNTASGQTGSVSLSNQTLTITGDGTPGGGAFTFAGAISGGAGGLTLSGGTLTLTGTNTYTGNTTINGGTLKVDGDGSIASSILTTVTKGGTLTGSGTVGNTTVENGGILAGITGSTLKMNNLILNNSSILNVTLGVPSSSANGLFQVDGNLMLDGTLNVSKADGFGDGLYRIIDYTGKLTDNVLNIGNAPDGYVTSQLTVQTIDAKEVNLIVGTVSKTSYNYWHIGDGTWDTTTANWSNYDYSAKGVYDPSAQLFIFFTGLEPTTGQGGTVTVDNNLDPLTIGPGIQFFHNGYTVQGDALELTESATILRVGDGTAAGMGMTATIGSILSGTGGIEKTDLGTLILTGDNTYTGATTIDGGKLVLTGKNAYTGATTINAGTLALSGTGSIEESSGVWLASPGTFDISGTTAGATIKTLNNTALGQTGVVSLGNQTLTITGGGAFGGLIEGNGGKLTLTGGTLNLTGANTYTGGTNLNAGRINVGNNSALGTGALLMSNETTLGFLGTYSLANTITLNGTDTIDVDQNAATGMYYTGTLSGIISGNGSLTKTGAGTLNLTGANTYTSGTNLNAGRINVGNNTALGGSPTTNRLTMASGTTLGFLGTYSIANVITLNGADTIDVGNNAYTGTLSGIISGDGSLTKIGKGTLNLTGANEYTGGTNLNDGRINVGSNTALGGFPATNRLTMANSTTLGFLDTYSIANAITLNGAGTIDVDQNAASGTYYTGTLSGIIDGTGNLTKTGAGTLNLTGANEYTGGTNLNYGRINVGSDTALGGSPTTNRLTMAGNTTLGFLGNYSLANAITLNGTDTIDVGQNPATGMNYTGTLSGIIDGTGSLTKTGAGTLTLSGTNDYTGATTINAGTLALFGSGSIEESSGVWLATDGIFDISGTAAGAAIKTLNDATSNQTGKVKLGGQTLTITDGGAFGGVISGDGGLTLTGGTLTLAGANDYTGATAINGGTLTLTGSITSNVTNAATFTNSGTVTGSVSNTGIFTQTTGTVKGGVTNNASGTVNANGGALDGDIVNRGSFNIGGTVTSDGAFTNQAGTLAVSDNGQYTLTGAFTQKEGATLDVNIGSNNNPAITAGSATLGGTLNIGGYNDTASVYTVIHTPDTSGGISDDFSHLTIGGTASSNVDYMTVTGEIIDNDYVVKLDLSWYADPHDPDHVPHGTFTLADGSRFDLRATLSDRGDIDKNTNTYGWDGKSLTKNGPGTLTLSGKNTYSGGTTINGGTLQISSDANLGAPEGGLSFNGGTLAVTGEGFAMNRDTMLGTGGGIFNMVDGGTLTQNGKISGGGGLTVAGGTLALTGANNYTGGTAIDPNATLLIDGPDGSIAGTVTNNWRLVFSNGSSASGTDIANNTDGWTYFHDNSTAGNATIINDGGTKFWDDSSAGSAKITNNIGGRTDFEDNSTAGGAIIINDGGLTKFEDNSSAGYAKISNNGGGLTKFEDGSTASSATITNDGGMTKFWNNSSAGNAEITNNSDGRTDFEDNSSAGYATIINNGGMTKFEDNSTASNAAITNNSGGVTKFEDNSTAGSATITNNTDGWTEFGNDSSAGNATITNDGMTKFEDNSTAGSASIINNGNGSTWFYGRSDAGNARLNNASADGVFDFSGTAGPGGDGKISAGSIEGSGTFNLGGNELTVGGNNDSTTVSGVITDGGNGGSLVKTGTGTLTLAGDNSYSGDTTVSQGTLEVTGSLGGGDYAGAIVNDATLIFNQRGDQSLAGAISGTGSLTKDGSGTLTLSGNNSYSGPTEVRGGTLALSGEGNISDTLALYQGATFATGGANVNYLNQLDVHGSAAWLGDLNMGAGQTMNFYLSPNTVDGDIMLSVSGMANITDSTVNVGVAGNSSLLRIGNTVVLIDAAQGGVTGAPINPASNAQWIMRQGSTIDYTFGLSETANQLLATIVSVKASEQSKSLSEGFLAGPSLVNQTGDLVTDKGISRAVEAAGGKTPGKQGRPTTSPGYDLGVFGTVAGGWSRYNTGSNVDLSSLSLMAGMSMGNDLAPGRLTAGAFVEYGNGWYDTYNSFATVPGDVRGKGNIYHLGGGVIGRLNFNEGKTGALYTEASVRAGGVSNDYKNGNLNGQTVNYNSDAAYYSLHAGLGYIWNLTEKSGLDFYGKYFWTRQNGDSERLSTGETVRFDNVDSHRLRMGGRFVYAASDLITPYAGLAYEHEFDGEAKATTNGLAINSPSLHGGTGIGEIGLTVKASQTMPLTVDLAVQGYAGTREGFTGSLQVRYDF